MRIVCIDFETANNFIGSICAVGLAIIEDGRVIDTKYWLVRPHEDYFYFDQFNVRIHGINENDVDDAPEFDLIYNQIKPLLNNTVAVAHNAAFDMSALRHVLDLYKIEYPEIDYLCTYKTALKTWRGLDNYKLNTICKFLNYDFMYHNAQEDAIACGKVFLSALATHGVLSVEELTSLLSMTPGKLFIGGYNPCSIANISKKNISKKIDINNIIARCDRFDQEHEFYGKNVMFTGTLSTMSRKEAMQKVVDVGGLIAINVTKDTDFLVMGMQDYSKFTDGKESIKTKKAKLLIAKGKQLQIIDEAEFLKLL